ncbi:hypothetical protein F2P56_034411 [Juglans regia]|uniref:Protein MIS12 homolog n=2 Tax=Juglans regia TaxID=51240 RepID=A0A6P9EGL0_JUGRE|nr:protein MIS12 homolog [Juglans regia]KAF5445360.1 hypothetical protein F2P56_034411 [Juglans regia]
MEGGESEAIFESLNLNPQLFINETLNTVDDLVDDAFHFFREQASNRLNTHATDRSEDLTKGIDTVRSIVQSVLDKRLAMWEKYCLRHCFALPQGFSLPKADEPNGDILMCEEPLCDTDLEAQLESLRNKLTVVGRESAVLEREFQSLEKLCASSNRSAGIVNEALELYETNSAHDFFQEMVRTASELRTRMLKLKMGKSVGTEQTKAEMFYNPNRDLSKLDSKGSTTEKLEELQQFLAEMKKL